MKQDLPVAASPDADSQTTGTDADSQRRTELEGFIRRIFRHAYRAQIRHFMPVLLGLRNARGKLIAALGLRAARHGPLFLEQYFEQPIEQVLQQQTQLSVQRNGVIELGNFASIHPGSARRLIVALAASLYDAGYEWVVFTITPSLVNSFRRLGLPLLPLGEASVDCLPADERARWGSYYDNRPGVYAGYIPGNIDRIHALLSTETFQLADLANELNRCRAHVVQHTLPCLI